MFEKIREMGIWYWFGRGVVKALLLAYNQLKVVGKENVPMTGGLLMVCNHTSHLDPPSLACASPRQLNFVAKQELFETFFLKWYLPSVGVIPIKRGSGGNIMLDKAEVAIGKGACVALFPEGTRTKTGIAGKPRTGIIVLAVRTGAPIIPARISGSFDCMPPGSFFPKPGKIQIAFGKPVYITADKVDLSNREQVVGAAKDLLEIIMALPGWDPRNAKKATPKEVPPSDESNSTHE
jgi:1-acyl-sn-glycerol-3-phosphate acyltransferase